MKVRWLENATVSLRAVHSHIALTNPQAAKRVVKAIRTATIRLGDFPESGRLGTVPGTREVVIQQLPYVVVYRLTLDAVEVIRVFHTATDWQGSTH